MGGFCKPKVAKKGGNGMEILYTDDDLCVVVKPVGLFSQGEGPESVPGALFAAFGRLFPVHRLDRGVGGVMVFARGKETAAALSASMAAGEWHKQYVAVVEGEVPENGRFCDLLYHDARQNKTFLVDRPRQGVREAVLTFFKEGRFADEAGVLSRVRVMPQTGRSHQIRAQFAGHGYPLVGDGKYGSRRKAAAPALFAASLTFRHPKSGKMCAFSAPLPAVYPFDLFGTSGVEIERKYLIAYPDTAALAAFPGACRKEITQTYLTAPAGQTLRVRRVCANGATRYIETRKIRRNDLAAVEEERELTADEYAAALKKADPALRPVEKTRWCLPYGGHVIEVDLFPFWGDRAVAEVELASESETAALPPCLAVVKEVTGDGRYRNARLAREVPFDDLKGEK